MAATEAARAFIAAINAHYAMHLAALMSEDHVFVDSLGQRIEGRAAMEAGWRVYFDMCPDYWVRVSHEFAADDEIAQFGEAGGTIKGRVWRTPAAWFAHVANGRVREWRIYADNKPVYDVLAR